MTNEIALVSDKIFIPTRTGLIINGEATDKEWATFGTQVKNAQEGILWILGDWSRDGEINHTEVYAETLERLGYSTQTVKDAKWLSGVFLPSRRRDDIEWSYHKEVAILASDGNKADELLEQTAEEGWTVQQLRKEVRKQKQVEPPPLPEDEFNVILADPPWQYDFSIDSKDDIEVHYPTMPIEEIKALKLPRIEQAVLFLWATAPKLREALEVMEAWGFTYKTNAVWDKEWIGMGYWFRGRHELLLVGTKGNISPPRTDARYDSVIRLKRSEHSVKPAIVYEIIEDMFPNGQRLELFARSKREGWTSWGNEV